MASAMLLSRGNFTTEPRPKVPRAASSTSLPGAGTSIYQNWAPTCSLLLLILKGGKMEDTSVNNGNKGVQGH